MRVNSRQVVRVLTAGALVPLFVNPQALLAQAAEHVVSSTELQKAASNASEARQQNIAELNGFFSSKDAQKALKSARIDPKEVKTAVASLNDAELAQLAAKASKAQNDFAAGNMDNRDLLILLVGIAVLILIIVAVR
jgi:hypothetical protein